MPLFTMPCPGHLGVVTSASNTGFGTEDIEITSCDTCLANGVLSYIVTASALVAYRSSPLGR